MVVFINMTYQNNYNTCYRFLAPKKEFADSNSDSLPYFLITIHVSTKLD